MIDRANIIYISIFIFINSVFYSILDLHTSDKIFSTTDFYIAIFFYFAYKFFPALIMGNILIKDLNNNKLILFLLYQLYKSKSYQNKLFYSLIQRVL